MPTKMRAGKAKGWFDAGTNEKEQNAPQALAAKIEVREKVLAELPEARVLDLFSGAERLMYEGAWRRAPTYVACDARPWAPGETARYVCDNRLLLRALDLRAFDVFDLDAYGEPFEQLLILAARRPWVKGERGAVVLTVPLMRLKFGRVSGPLAQLVGMDEAQGVPNAEAGAALLSVALKAWCGRSGVAPVRMWIAEGKGRAGMIYLGVVFEGVG